LDDETRAAPLSHGDDPRTAAQRLTQLREQRATDLHALAEQLSQPVEQQPPAEAAPEAQQPEQQPPEQPPPVDPLEQERQRVRQEADALGALRTMSAKEIQLTVEAQQLDALLTQKYGAKVVLCDHEKGD
jgi:hypothetical protein